jgi:hypothetical protein
MMEYEYGTCVGDDVGIHRNSSYKRILWVRIYEGAGRPTTGWKAWLLVSAGTVPKVFNFFCINLPCRTKGWVAVHIALETVKNFISMGLYMTGSRVYFLLEYETFQIATT